MEKTLDFSYSWNGSPFHFKIHNKYFTSIRLHNPEKYSLNNTYSIFYNKQFIKHAKPVIIRKSSLNGLSDLFFFLDTGYSKEASLKIFGRIYKMREPDFNTMLFDVILFETVYTVGNVKPYKTHIKPVAVV